MIPFWLIKGKLYIYIIYKNFSKFCILSLYGSRAIELKINFCEDLSPNVYICCKYVTISLWKKLVVNKIPWGCSFVFVFTSCISCKNNNWALHTNNIIIAKLKNCWIVVSSANTPLMSKILMYSLMYKTVLWAQNWKPSFSKYLVASITS